jgi:acetolactate synthase small subunit
MNKLKLSEVSNLINIRNYIRTAIDNFSIDKPKVNKMNKILSSLDNTIVDQIIQMSEQKDQGDNEKP